MLNLMEELFLLALHEKGEKGRVNFTGGDLRYGLAGAALTELSLQGKIQWDDGEFQGPLSLISIGNESMRFGMSGHNLKAIYFENSVESNEVMHSAGFVPR